MMTCRELSDFLDAYLDGELDSSVREVFECHLAACPPCIHYLDSYRETIDLCRDSFAGESLEGPPPEELVRAILEAKRRG